MAAFVTATKVFVHEIGDMLFGCYKVIGDDSGSTFTAPVGNLLVAWGSNIDSATPVDRVSHATNVITASVDGDDPLTTGDYIHLFFIGTA